MLSSRVLNVGAALVVGSFLGSSCTRGPGAIDFADSLTGPVSPALSIPFSSYALTPTGLLRTHASSGTENGIDRPVIKTVSGEYLSREFIFDVDVTIPADHGDIAYVGFGKGENNRLYENEPTYAYLFRIHNLPRMPFYGIDIAVGDPKRGKGSQGHFREFERVAEYTRGEPMRFQIAHQGGQVTLAVPSIPDARVTFQTAQFGDLFDSQNAFLFLANSSQGTTFRNASLRRP